MTHILHAKKGEIIQSRAQIEKNIERYKKVSRTLKRYDGHKGISMVAMDLARKRGHIVDEMEANAGRKLHYYSGVLAEMSKRIGGFKGKRVLHIASSTGILTRFLQDRKALAVGLEFDESLCHVARQIGNRTIIRADASLRANAKHILPFSNNSFNCLVTDRFAFSKYKLLDLTKEHEGSQEILKEAARVLNPKGVFIISGVDPYLDPHELIQICERYFNKVEPFAYAENKILIPCFALSEPKKAL
ncbi:Ubiquinone/menaquinone biosynthesis C-methyltransferase UbiE [uncultured archaeon]|nr:Ubiquinone/menaquinone biosynthesis C-methyltransferase UbiE [uncultured archaeon]